MTVSAGDAHEFPIYNCRFRALFPILDNTGAKVTGAAGLDSEASQDQGTYTDCTNEATEIATSSGDYYLDIISTELDTKSTMIQVKTSTTNAKTTTLALFPRRLPVIHSGTAQAGAAGTITLASGAVAIDNYYVGCFVRCSNDTPSNVLGMARRITAYVGSTRVATVEANWGTNPSSSTTYEILLTAENQIWLSVMPQVVAGSAGGLFIAGTNAATTITTALTTTFTGNLTGSVASVSGAVGSVTGAVGSVTGAVGSVGSGGITAASIASNAITDAKMNTDAFAKAFTSAVTEAYSTKGSTVTLANFIYEVLQQLQEYSTGGTTTGTVKKRDQSTTALTTTLNNATAPTSVTRAT